MQTAPPPWVKTGEITLPGSALRSVGIAVPVLAPAQALLLRASAIG